MCVDDASNRHVLSGAQRGRAGARVERVGRALLVLGRLGLRGQPVESERRRRDLVAAGTVALDGVGELVALESRVQLVRGLHELLRELLAELDVFAVAAVARLAPAARGDQRLGAGSRDRVRECGAEQRVDEGGLLEAARHELAKHVHGLGAEAVDGTVPRLVAHLVLTLDHGHLEGSRDRHQTARILLDQLVLALVQVLLQFLVLEVRY